MNQARYLPIVLSLLAAPAAAQSDWIPATGAQPGFIADNLAITHAGFHVWDDGTGPALYASGDMEQAGGVPVNRIAKWDGEQWSALGNGLAFATKDFAVFDAGSGPELYLYGSLKLVEGGSSPSGLVRWNGTSWSLVPVTLGPSGGGGPFVVELETFDDGNGPALYVAGKFDTVDGVSAPGVARWDGSTWSALGSGIEPTFETADVLHVHDDGGGPALYVGGEFLAAGGVSSPGVARWNGTAWSGLGNGLPGSVVALTTYSGGGTPVLVAGGLFTVSGGVQRVARWDGSQWSIFGADPGFGTIVSLGTYDEGAGERLFVGALFEAWRWDGSIWDQPFGPAFQGDLREMTVFDPGDGPRLCADLRVTGVATGNNFLTWDGASLQPSQPGLDDFVQDAAVHDDGSGEALYVVGDFLSADGLWLDGVARWDGSASWSAVGTPPATAGSEFLLAVESYDAGSGPQLYVGGRWGTQGIDKRHVARWDNGTWTPILAFGFGSSALVNDFCVADLGAGPKLFATGQSTSGSAPVGANGILAWDGVTWTTLGTGLGSSGQGHALAVYDDGTGPLLVVGGEFTTAGGVSVGNVAAWDGATWHAMGSLNDVVEALTVVEEDGVQTLYAGGRFDDGGDGQGVARWDGAAWQPLGTGFGDFCYALAAFDDGSGPALYAGGANGSPGPGGVLVKWDGAGWTALSPLHPEERYLSLTVFDDGRDAGPALWVGGDHWYTGAGDSYLAKWGPMTWRSFGGGTAGVQGTPRLVPFGTLAPGSPLNSRLEKAPPGELVLLWAALASASFPALGGTVWPFPPLLQRFFFTNGAGELSLASTWPAGVPPGTEVWLQYLCQDLTTVHGITLSNGVRGVAP